MKFQKNRSFRSTKILIKLIDKCHKLLFSEKNLKLFETAILFLAVTGFIAHLLLIYLNINYELDYLSKLDNLFTNPISALYTPFSFILIYEVFYLFIIYLDHLQPQFEKNMKSYL